MRSCFVLFNFEIESVMHYPSYNEFAIDRNKPTLTKKDGTPIGMNSVFSKVCKN